MAVSNLSFQEIVQRHRKLPWVPGRKVLALDPGETTGWSLFQDDRLVQAGQIVPEDKKDPASAITEIQELIRGRWPDFVVHESYKVYEWKTDDHAWNEMHTSQVIGGIKFICRHLRSGPRTDFEQLPCIPQTAQVAKQFVTDEKLKRWGFWIKGQQHARDAIRHAVWFILFGEEKWLKAQQT